MDTILFIALLLASLVYNMKQYKQLKKCNCDDKPIKKSAYKQSWNNGGKASQKWDNKDK